MKKLLLIIILCLAVRACFSVIGKWVDTTQVIKTPTHEFGTAPNQIQTEALKAAPAAPAIPTPSPAPTNYTDNPPPPEPPREDDRSRPPELSPDHPEEAHLPRVETVDRNALVSCQTKTRFCEPQDQMNFPDGDVTTFCTTYAANCLDPKEPVRKVWEHHEVFRSQVVDPRDTYVDPANNYPESPPYPENPPSDPGYNDY